MITRAFGRRFQFDVRLVWAAVLTACAAHVACDSAPLLAPTNSRITLTVSNRVLPLGGSATLSATVLENSGSPVPNGTTVRFITTLGRVEPVEAQTSNGTASATFFAGDASGMAEVQAISGLATGSGTNNNATPNPTTPPTTTTPGTTPTPPTTPSTNNPGTNVSTAGNVVQITIGAAAVQTVTVRANPGSVGPNGGTVTVTALVSGVSGRTIANIPVVFTANNGQLSPASAVTNELGEASATLTTDRETTISATAGTVTSATATVGVRLGPAITFTCALATGTAQSCAAVTIGQSVTFTVTPAAGTTGTGGTGGTAGSSRIREVVVDFGDGESVNLGAVSGATTVGHTYATAGNFTARATATDTAGEQVTSTQFIRVTGPLGLEITAQIVSGRRVRATANVTGLGTASVVQYEWTFQGGSPNSITTTPTAEFTYDSQGDKQISVRVTTTDGRTGTATTTINIPN